MLSSAALRAQIASVIDALSKAAVAEIAKLVEDGMVVLRLEMCQRDCEIQKLKSNIEVLHGELRATRVGTDAQGGTEKVHGGTGHNTPSAPEAQVKREPGEQGSGRAGGRPGWPGREATAFERDGAQWRRTTHEPGRNNSNFLNVGQNSLAGLSESSLDAGLAVPCGSGLQQSPFIRGLLGYGQSRNLYNTVRRRTAKRLMFKKGYICPYCGKCFERSGHLERHKRIHTGEKPYRCEICGRRFNQKCSLKEHTKIHRRGIPPVEIQVSEQKHVPEENPGPDGRHSEKMSPANAENGRSKKEDALPTPVRVKSEPTEEKVSQPLFQGKEEEPADALNNLAAFDRDGQQWMSRLQGHGDTEASRDDFQGSSAPNAASFPGTAPLRAEACGSSFSYPGSQGYREIKSGVMSQPAYGSSDELLASSDAVHPGLHGASEASLNQYQQWGGRPFQVIRPKKSFACSYCSKIFERAGHLERHLRIHTGEKPYGCHICGRCFNQKSSLKGHMKTHRIEENADLQDSHQLMFTMPDNQPLENLAEPKSGLAALEEQLPGAAYSEATGEQVLMLKVEQGEEDFQTFSRAENDDGADAPAQSRLWIEKSGTIVLHDIEYQLSPPEPAEQRGYALPNKSLPFVDDKETMEIIHGGHYPLGMQSANSDEQDQLIIEEVVVNEYGAVTNSTQEVFKFEITNSGTCEDGGGGGGGLDAARQNCVICSSCGQSFHSFCLFQSHRCNNNDK